MKKIMLILSLGMILLTACQSQLKPADVVLASAKGWDAGDIDAAKMDASLAYFTDDAIVKLVGLPPDQTNAFSGKEQIRGWWEGLATQHFNMTLEVLNVDGNAVTTKTLSWMDWSRQAGIAPIEAIEVYVVKNGKITSETWTITEDSKAKMMAVLAPPLTQTPQLKLDEIVKAAMTGWNSEEVGADQINTTLAYFADGAVFKMVGFPPEIKAEFVGKEAIRAAYESWLPLHPRLDVKPMKVEGNTVTASTSYWSDPTRGLGVTPLVGTDVYVFEGDKIVSETWTLTDESQQKFSTALATVTAPTPTPTLAPETPISSLADVVGSWRIWIGGDPNLLRFLPDGRFIVNENSSKGTIAVEGSQVHFLTESYCPSAQEARYEVYVIKQDGTPVRLRFVLVGEDGCAERKDALDGKNLVPAKP